MSKKTRQVKKFQDTMYTIHTQSLHGETIYEYIKYFQWPEYEYRLGRQVWAPIWFSAALPLKSIHTRYLSGSWWGISLSPINLCIANHTAREAWKVLHSTIWCRDCLVSHKSVHMWIKRTGRRYWSKSPSWGLYLIAHVMNDDADIEIDRRYCNTSNNGIEIVCR